MTERKAVACTAADGPTPIRVRFDGDIRRAFSVVVELPVGQTLDNVSTEESWVKALVAERLGLTRLGREEGLQIDDFVQIDENDCEVETRGDDS